KNGSKSDVFPNPNARRKCTPAPSIVGFDLITLLIGRIDIRFSYLLPPVEGGTLGGFFFPHSTPQGHRRKQKLKGWPISLLIFESGRGAPTPALSQSPQAPIVAFIVGT